MKKNLKITPKNSKKFKKKKSSFKMNIRLVLTNKKNSWKISRKTSNN